MAGGRGRNEDGFGKLRANPQASITNLADDVPVPAEKLDPLLFAEP